MTIFTRKLGTVYAATKFTQGSTSNHQLVVKILDPNSKSCKHEKILKIEYAYMKMI